MERRNRYYARSRISERKFRQLLRYFAMDFSATDVAQLTGIRRKAVTAIFLKIRRRIAEECERVSPFSGEVEIDECYFGARRVRGKRGRGASGKTPVFGLLKREGRVYTEVVPDCSKATLRAIIRGRIAPETVIHSDGWRGYDGLVDVGYSKHYRVNHGKNESARGTHHINGIESFWSFAKHRLQKFHGIAPHTFYLHLKECEWRFNMRHSQQRKRPPARKAAKLAKEGKKVESKSATTLMPATVNRELACLKILFNHFIKDDVIFKNPVSRVKFLAENNEQMRVLSPDEEKLYLLAASQPLEHIATLMLETGMRPEEVCRIRRENIHLEHGYLFNPYGKTKSAKRKVPLSDKAAAVLSKRLADVKGDYLFPGRGVGDAPIVKVNNAHTATLKRSGVRRFRLYDLRHTWATRAAMAGVDLVTLAAMLGHSRVHMVMRYAHPTEEHQFNAMKKVQTFVAGGLKK